MDAYLISIFVVLNLVYMIYCALELASNSIKFFFYDWDVFNYVAFIFVIPGFLFALFWITLIKILMYKPKFSRKK